jgi:hypothetical protein
MLRGDKNVENHFTTETRSSPRTQWDVKLGHFRLPGASTLLGSIVEPCSLPHFKQIDT